jgi:hypothetical protein
MPIANKSPPRTMSGARAQLIISDGKESRVVGIFNNVSYGLTYGAQDVYTLGRFSANEIVYTSQETIHITASGFRVIDHGPHVSAKLPTLLDLIEQPELEIWLNDRQTDKTIARIHHVKALSFSTSISAKNLEEITVTFMGLVFEDESSVDKGVERADASVLP